MNRLRTWQWLLKFSKKTFVVLLYRRAFCLSTNFIFPNTAVSLSDVRNATTHTGSPWRDQESQVLKSASWAQEEGPSSVWRGMRQFPFSWKMATLNCNGLSESCWWRGTDTLLRQGTQVQSFGVSTGEPSIPQSQQYGSDSKRTGKAPPSRPYYAYLAKNGNCPTVQKWERC